MWRWNLQVTDMKVQTWASFNLIGEQQMVWLTESTSQFPGHSHFLNEKAPLGMQKPPSKAVKRPNCSYKARNDGRRQIELGKLASKFVQDLTQILQWSLAVVSMYVCFDAYGDNSSFCCLVSILLWVRELEFLNKIIPSYSLNLWWRSTSFTNSSSMCNGT